MPTYVYETISARRDDAPTTFELKQSIADDALTTHPETGVPVRRVLSGGLATFTHGQSNPAPPAMGCGSSCGCVS